jgi:hypothetical protein
MTDTAKPFCKKYKKESSHFKPKRWSHQDELANAKDKRIVIYNTIDHGYDEYKLIDADQFTLKVLLSDKSILTVFKHAITGYKIVE